MQASLGTLMDEELTHIVQSQQLLALCSWRQCNLASTVARACQSDFLAPRFRVPAFDVGEGLQDADYYVGCFEEGKLLCNII